MISGAESLASNLRSQGDLPLDDIKMLSMDMGYICAACIHFPHTVDKIAFDHFHVEKMLCTVVDKTRQAAEGSP